MLSLAPDRAPSGLDTPGLVRLTLCLWRSADGTELARHKTNADETHAVALAPDAQHFLTGDRDGTIRLRHAKTGKVVRELKNEGESTAVASLRVSPGGRRILAGYDDCTLRLWDVQTGTQLASFLQHVGPVTALGFSRDATHALSGGADHTVRLWKLPD